MMCSEAISVVACENHHGVFPEVMPVDFGDDFAYFTVNGLNQAAVGIAGFLLERSTGFQETARGGQSHQGPTGCFQELSSVHCCLF